MEPKYGLTTTDTDNAVWANTSASARNEISELLSSVYFQNMSGVGGKAVVVESLPFGLVLTPERSSVDGI